jgi:hypothetical protein
MKILLIYYHPVIWDLAQTFIELRHEVTVAVNIGIKDNYGTGADIIQRAPKYFSVIPLQLALRNIQLKQYDLVGCDGVFDGDKLVMESCDKNNIPRFCIQGYPNVGDEPSDNILSFGWFTPTVQYHQRYPSEGHKKQQDWKAIAEAGESEGKNICVFYPKFWDLKEKIKDKRFKCLAENGYISLIQGYEKWNKWSFEAFKRVEKAIKVRNLEGLDHDEALLRLAKSKGLVHLKWADQPGIALIEAMLLRKPVYTMRSFVLASMNQEVLIDGYNAIVADSVDELIRWLKQDDLFFRSFLRNNAEKHALMLTDFYRQKRKLERFMERCIDGR